MAIYMHAVRDGYAVDDGQNQSTLVPILTPFGEQRVVIDVGGGHSVSSTNPLPVVLEGGSSVIGHVITDSGSVTNATLVGPLGQAAMASSLPVAIASNQSNVPVSQATASALNAQVVGTAAAGAAASGNPVQIGGVYNSSAPTPSTGQIEPLQLDASGNLQSNLATLIAGENQTLNRLMTVGFFNYTNITGDATTTVKSGAGILRSITLNAPTATEIITIFDNTTNSGTKIGTITIPASPQPVTLRYDVAFNTGLTIVTATATSDITISYL